MASLLAGAIKAQVAKAFKGKLTRGVLRQETSTTQDSFGDLTPGAPQTYPFEGIRYSFSAFTAAQAGIPLTDVKVLVILGSLPNGVTPEEGDKVYLNAPWNRWHQVRRVLAIDPAQATAELQCFEVPAP